MTDVEILFTSRRRRPSSVRHRLSGLSLANLVVTMASFATTARTATMMFRPALAFVSLRPSSLGPRLPAVASSRLFVSTAPQGFTGVPRKFVPTPFDYHKELTLRVDALTNLGIGICRHRLKEEEDPSVAEAPTETRGGGGWVIMVPNVIPGELIRCRVYRNHKSYSDADLMEVVEASPDRVNPACELAAVCGGCQYQHMTVARQREWKARQVDELFERVAGLEGGEIDRPDVLPTVGTDEVYNYRSKITPHYDRPKDGAIEAIGFKQKSSRRIVDVPYCHIATDAINDKLEKVREDKFAEAREGRLRRPKKGATVLLRDANEGVVTDSNEYVTTPVRHLTFRLRAGNFFQNNPFMLPVMVDLVVDAASRPHIRTGEFMTHLIDCYCGSGLFALGSASHFDTCVGIEVNDEAVKEARVNAELNGVGNCRFVSASAEAIFESKDAVTVGEDGIDVLVDDFPRDTTTVVVDPPRKGCSEEFLEQLNAFQPARVVYMSCDPSTQARDAKYLVETAGYEVASIQPLDLFPQTRHIECLAVFERK